MTTPLSVFTVLPALPPADAFALQTRPARWTSGALPVIYSAEHAAAALLEYRAHLQSTPVEELLLAQAWLPEGDVPALTLPAHLPWRERPYRADVQALGDDWLAQGKTLAARVPSALCAEEFNVLINPQHALFARIRFDPVRPFRLDQRLG